MVKKNLVKSAENLNNNQNDENVNPANDNPADSYGTGKKKKPKTPKNKPEPKEKKTLISAFITPSVWDNFKDLAAANEKSAGELLDQVIEDYNKANAGLLADFKAFRERRDAKKEQDKQ